MTTTLPEALRALAEKAGNVTLYVKTTDTIMWAYADDIPMAPIPGADGTLSDAECTVVLGWLAKAGYETYIGDGQVNIIYMEGEKQMGANIYAALMGEADTLNAALAAAVVALEAAQ